ncbi:PadR family transcriptional regulator [Frateuria aurantia]|uniref:Putative transcriptional regulator n=1 Tax=Frateuria aurantia (strain ATCC 33424 / DSM 6220 / KCTC 2777 / LMG 1558 / NBRC 3245 / NCIMB 13370) TaxID=767434 RepID=H8L1L4_FRAAD|nr:PadR family transcriptional regulator [Frateuria aurantia]AFC85374.1 putative transcriptional regulator [Frateuria aurantia DSM 6220]
MSPRAPRRLLTSPPDALPAARLQVTADPDHDPARVRHRQRIMGHGDFRLILLALIAEAPRHGYELIQSISEAFHGHYSPSPGSIYPLLAQWEQSGHTCIDPNSRGRKRYEITPLGSRLLQDESEAVSAAFERLRHSARQTLKQALPEDIRKAMHALKHALMMHGSDWAAEEIADSAAAIHQAAQAIAGRSRHA